MPCESSPDGANQRTFAETRTAACDRGCMTSLAGYCEKYAALLQGGKGDSQAPQLERLHEIYQLL